MAIVVKLPDEILLRILGYLQPVDQISFADACERFLQLSYDRSIVRKVDLSGVSAVSMSEFIFYFGNQMRSQNITELNLNDRVLPDLEKSILHCTNLKALHILHCDLRLSNLCNILMHLPYLTTLSWSMLNDTTNVDELLECLIDNYSTSNLHLQCLKSLYIELWDANGFVVLLGYFLRYCKNLEQLHIQLWERRIYDPLVSISTSVDTDFRTFELNLPQLNNLMITQGQGELERHQCMMSSFKSLTSLHIIVRSIFRSHNPSSKWKTIWISPAANQILITLIDAAMTSEKFDQYDSPNVVTTCGYRDTEEKYRKFKLNLVQNVKNDVIRHLEIQHAYLAPSDLSTVARVGGTVLKKLSLYNCVWQPDHEAVQYPLALFFETCRNITELNLNKCHFKVGDNLCSALVELKFLSRIQLQECGIASENLLLQCTEESEFDVLMQHPQDSSRLFQLSALLPVVEQCPNVIEFSVRGCREDIAKATCCCVNLDQKSCTDEDLLPVCRWKKLESLTCFNLARVDHGKFLEYATEKCQHLKTLKISRNPDLPGVSIFQVSLCNAIRKAKSLKDIKIQYKFLDLTTGLLWNALSNAKKLERICIECCARGALDVNIIYRLFEELPQICVFHVHSTAWNSRRVSEQLKKKVQHVALRRGVGLEVLVMLRDEFRFGPNSAHWIRHTGHILHLSELCVFSSRIAVPLKY